MIQFKDYLNKTKEIGYVEKVYSSIIYIKGLPEVRTSELVIFETGQIGQVYSLTTDYVEVLLLTKGIVPIGTKVARTNETLKIGVGDYLLGKTLNSLAQPIDGTDITEKPSEYRLVDTNPPGINFRKNIDKPFETGVTIVDLVTPLGKGQRELIIGDRKTNKTQFLLQVLYTQAKKGTVCIYTAIAKRKLDILMIKNFLANSDINKNTILLASSPDEVPGLIFLTPYTAITIAEHFRDQGRDVLIILDDMTAHAKYYREISLLAERFPGRSSYPGDIFYIHAKIMERAGNFILQDKETAPDNNPTLKGNNFREVSITCLPVAEMVMGDFSGYIQTNLMAMTDGHIYFDREYFNQGRRPAVNPFLSVTRVGRQAQSELLKELSRILTSFLVHHEKLRQFMHFGAELSEETRRNLDLGDKILTLFDQSSNTYVPLNLSLILFSCIWAGIWKEKEVVDLKSEIKKFSTKYVSDKTFKDRIDALIAQSNNFVNLIDTLRNNQMDILQSLAQTTT